MQFALLDPAVKNDRISDYSLGVLSSANDENPYCDRCCSPADTVSKLWPNLRDFGITRVADQTMLDRIGIPTYAAFRPNSRTLAVNQGKGLNHDSAMASAIMEAVEFSVAENPQLERVISSKSELLRSGWQVFDPIRQMPMGQVISPDAVLEWVIGRDLFSREPIAVPIGAIMLDGTVEEPFQITRTTNGLASGNTETEAVFHGLCELIERDSTTLYPLWRAKRQGRDRLDPRELGDPAVDHLSDQIESAGLQLHLLDQTIDLEIPAFMAVISEPERALTRHFDVAAGYGCHPVPARAAIRAITEAAQSRITNIAGSRDDFDPGEYQADLAPELLEFVSDIAAQGTKAPSGNALSTPLETLLAGLMERLRQKGITKIVVVPLCGDEYGIKVVKILAPQLEDRPCNPNWRPGARAAQYIIGEV